VKKRIGIFIGEIAQNYQKQMAQYITGRANELGYDTVFICSYGSYNEDIIYAVGGKACVYLPDVSQFSGLIVAEDVFDITGMGDELYEVIKEKATCPVVYLRTIRDGCYSVLPENKKSIEKMVRHFTDEHGFTDICYMSGKKETDDAKERLDGYMEVMKEKGIEVTEHMIFHGDYWRNKGKEAVDWFMHDRDTYPQAIVCANDYMALSICEELKARNIRVPEDVCVSGFDFIYEARVNTPTLTSLEVDFEAMAINAVDIIHGVNCGIEQKSIQTSEAIIRLHRSCGCGRQHEYDDVLDIVESVYKHIDDAKNSFISVTDYQDALGFDEYMAVADRYRRFLRTDKAYFCFCDEDEMGYGEVENDSVFTDQVILRRIFEGTDVTEKPEIKFQRKKLLPDEFWKEDECNNFCIFTIHFKNIVYGYVVSEIGFDKWYDIYTQGYLMTLANAIHNCDVHRRIEKLEVIKSIYQKDALTGIYNRRGFDKLFQKKFFEAKANGDNIGIVSIDMDNLKFINDTYGHAEGDRALIALANALSSVLNAGDFCARTGGDEFAAVFNINYPERCNEFTIDFLEALKRESLNIEEYDVEASIGICESIEPVATSLATSIQVADKRMYDNKKSRKAQR